MGKRAGRGALKLLKRPARSAPLVAEFGDWMQAQRLRISGKSRLGEKLTYIHSGLHVVIDAPGAGPTEEGERLVVGIKTISCVSRG